MILMRHSDCHPDYPSDPELTTAGRQRVRSQFSWLADCPVDVIICSDKRRAMQTVEELLSLFPAARHEINPHFREIHPLAISDGRHADAVRAAIAFEQFVQPCLQLPFLLVAHRNILSYFCRRIGIKQDFREFCAYAIV
jgi:phosphohistidine phosphatase SixA